MTKIIGHRGAAGLALENTLESIRAAIRAGVDAIEFDVHATKDGKIVVCHDNHLARISDSTALLQSLTYEELQKISLRNGETVPTLRQVLEIAEAHAMPVIIEIKVKGYTEKICSIADEYPGLDITFASFRRGVIETCRKLKPEAPAMVGRSGAHPFEIVEIAKREHATGIDFNFRLLNPLTYWLCKRAGLQIMVYTVRSKRVGNLIRRLYPEVWICTDYPNKFIKKS